MKTLNIIFDRKTKKFASKNILCGANALRDGENLQKRARTSTWMPLDRMRASLSHLEEPINTRLWLIQAKRKNSHWIKVTTKS